MRVLIMVAMLLGGNAYAESYGDYATGEKALSAVGSQYIVKPEPHTPVDRHVLSEADYKQDATILIAGQRVTPKFEVSEPKPAPAELIREVLPQANPMADVTVRATISSDTEEEVNYPL